MDIISSSDTGPLTTAVIKANISNIITDSKILFDQIKQEIQKSSINDENDSSDDENIDSSTSTVDNDTYNKLSSLSERFEESALIVMSCLDIANSRITELEDSLRIKDEKIILQKNTILRLSHDQTNWSETNPELLSLRRSHNSRLDHLCKITKELELLKRKNKLLQKNEEQIKADCARASLSLAKNCDRLRSEYESERIKSTKQSKEIRELRKQLHKNKKIEYNPIQKQSLKLLQKQLRKLNLSNKTIKNKKQINNQIVNHPSTSSILMLPDDIQNISSNANSSNEIDENKAISDIKKSLLAEVEKFENNKWQDFISSTNDQNFLINELLSSISDFSDKINSPKNDDMIIEPPDDPPFNID